MDGEGPAMNAPDTPLVPSRVPSRVSPLVPSRVSPSRVPVATLVAPLLVATALAPLRAPAQTPRERSGAARVAPPAGPRATTLVASRFTFTLAGRDLACVDGTLGGAYPSPTIVTLPTAEGVGALRDVRGSGNDATPAPLNAATARHLDKTRTCAALKPVLEAASHAGEGERAVTEEFLRDGAGVCLRVLQERLTLRVAGLSLEGRARFVVGPAAGCAPPAKPK